MRSKDDFPPKPSAMVDASGKYEIVPLGTILKVRKLDPRTPEEVRIANELGPVIRITYARETYDLAILNAKQLIESGRHPERIQLVRADRDIMDLLNNRQWSLKVLTPEEGETE